MCRNRKTHTCLDFPGGSYQARPLPIRRTTNRFSDTVLDPRQRQLPYAFPAARTAPNIGRVAEKMQVKDHGKSFSSDADARNVLDVYLRMDYRGGTDSFGSRTGCRSSAKIKGLSGCCDLTALSNLFTFRQVTKVQLCRRIWVSLRFLHIPTQDVRFGQTQFGRDRAPLHKEAMPTPGHFRPISDRPAAFTAFRLLRPGKETSGMHTTH
jgi:hypothetical protein